MTEFLVQWFWYLIAFAVGALVAWLAARRIKPTSEDEAFADLPDARVAGGRR